MSYLKSVIEKLGFESEQKISAFKELLKLTGLNEIEDGRPCRLREEHDYRCGADGRRDSGLLGRRRPDAADPRTHPAGAPGRCAVHRGLHEQGRHGRRRRAVGAGGNGNPRVADQVRLPG